MGLGVLEPRDLRLAVFFLESTNDSEDSGLAPVEFGDEKGREDDENQNEAADDGGDVNLVV